MCVSYYSYFMICVAPIHNQHGSAICIIIVRCEIIMIILIFLAASKSETTSSCSHFPPKLTLPTFQNILTLQRRYTFDHAHVRPFALHIPSALLSNPFHLLLARPRHQTLVQAKNLHQRCKPPTLFTLPKNTTNTAQ